MLYKRLPLEEFMAIYHKVPLAVVDVMINSKDGILLTKRATPPFKLILPKQLIPENRSNASVLKPQKK